VAALRAVGMEFDGGKAQAIREQLEAQGLEKAGDEVGRAKGAPCEGRREAIAVGSHVYMLFDDGVWYPGVVTKFNPSHGKRPYTIVFEDGDMRKMQIPHPDVRLKVPGAPERAITKAAKLLWPTRLVPQEARVMAGAKSLLPPPSPPRAGVTPPDRCAGRSSRLPCSFSATICGEAPPSTETQSSCGESGRAIRRQHEATALGFDGRLVEGKAVCAEHDTAKEAEAGCGSEPPPTSSSDIEHLQLRDEVQALKRQLAANESEMARQLLAAKEQLAVMRARKDAELRELQFEVKHLRQLAATVEVHDVDQGSSTLVEDCEVEGAAERVARERAAGAAIDLDDVCEAMQHVESACNCTL
jgi:hypothetical protein